ncbi:hypothetical protein GS896_25385 [Rhodococcus hoagii]|nr:hypothetical protein [Prescottella equi]MBM4574708.1 hypothetical protein [Prescottella equi]MBM4574908.1 hypothetical protein [Prescottella equi]MBM4654162.1 hypothetical protein [Prescottella equi]MBM4719634.1 hypothetical protein [Prescottella equi]
MTVIHMTTAALPMHEMLGGALTAREQLFRRTIRDTLTGAGLSVTEVFAKGAAPRVLTEILPDGSEEQTTYITLTVGVDIAAPAEVIEQAFSTLSLPEFPASAWRFPED